MQQARQLHTRTGIFTLFHTVTYDITVFSICRNYLYNNRFSIFVRQLEYMLCADLGFRSHDVITCRMYVDKLGLYKTTKEEGLDEGKRQYISNALVNKRMSESTLFEHWSRGNDLLFTDFRLTVLRSTEPKTVSIRHYLHI